MSVIVTRAGKGAPLSWVEADANFTNLNNDKLEAGTPATNIAVTPTGGIVATDVQAALAELDTELSGTVTKTASTGAAVIPTGTTANRPGVPTEGHFRRNSELGQWEGYDGSQWSDIGGASGGFRNILINGDMQINQRGVTIAAAANGTYGPDRWKKVDASNMTQIVEARNYKPNSTYTLSGTGVTTQQITSPASGNWTLPNVPITATKIQLEEGSIATTFEQRPIGLELSLCERYYEHVTGVSLTTPYSTFMMRQTKRTVPTLLLVSISTGTGFGATPVDSKSIYQSSVHSTNASFILAASAEL